MVFKTMKFNILIKPPMEAQGNAYVCVKSVINTRKTSNGNNYGREV